jgi:hypothetical protein
MCIEETKKTVGRKEFEMTDLESENASGRTRSENAARNLPLCHTVSTAMHPNKSLMPIFYAGIVFALWTFMILTSRLEHHPGTDRYIMIAPPVRGTRTQPKKLPVKGQCPFAVKKNVGVFDKLRRSEDFKFRDVILLVSSNYAYYNLLQNWEYLAKELGLKWAVLALDEDLYEELGPERAVPPGGDNASVSGPQAFRKGDFNKMSCNKMKLVLEIAENCDVDVVFTDADNIFYQNPFHHDLGRLIRSKRQDYIYQSNFEPTGGTPGTDQCLWGNPRTEGNTGFYYFNRKSNVLKEIYEATLQSCNDPDNELDAQTLFWQTFWQKDDSKKTTTFHHCHHDEYLKPIKTKKLESEQQSGSSFRVCCMDPYYYPTGDHANIVGPHNKDPITYHANYVSGYQDKIEKLINSREDHYGWNASRTIDGHGGLLGSRREITHD